MTVSSQELCEFLEIQVFMVNSVDDGRAAGFAARLLDCHSIGNREDILCKLSKFGNPYARRCIV